MSIYTEIVEWLLVNITYALNCLLYLRTVMKPVGVLTDSVVTVVCNFVIQFVYLAWSSFLLKDCSQVWYFVTIK